MHFENLHEFLIGNGFVIEESSSGPIPDLIFYRDRRCDITNEYIIINILTKRIAIICSTKYRFLRAIMPIFVSNDMTIL